jgi:hypothetical protein
MLEPRMHAPNYKELISILMIGALQPIIDMSAGPTMAQYYNLCAATVVLGYVIYRLLHAPSLLTEWGFRRDNIRATLSLYVLFTLIAGCLVYAHGAYYDRTPVPVSFWYLLALYPVWGIAQQFALQNFVARNLTTLLPNILVRAGATALIFSLSHAPSIELRIVTALAGFFFTLLYHYAPNLILLGISHGFLGALVFYLVLNQDQWAVLQQNLR